MNQNSLFHLLLTNSINNESIVQEIVSNFERKELIKNEYFLREGDLNNEYLFLENGFMRTFTHDLDNNDVTTGFYSTNQFVFEPASFFNQSVSNESIQALSDCVVYVITFEKLNKLFHGIPEFREFGRSILVRGFASLKQRTLSLINESAEVRYNKFLQTNKEIFQHAQLKQIASYLGITDTSLSRIRKENARL